MTVQSDASRIARIHHVRSWGSLQGTLLTCALALLAAGCSVNGTMEPIYVERGDRITVGGNQLRHYRCVGSTFVCQSAPGRFSRRDCICR